MQHFVYYLNNIDKVVLQQSPNFELCILNKNPLRKTLALKDRHFLFGVSVPCKVLLAGAMSIKLPCFTFSAFQTYPWLADRG